MDQGLKATVPKPNTLSPYAFHGVRLDVRGGEAVGDCPFCGRDGKFNVSVVTGQWRCWVCPEGEHDTKDGPRTGGNLASFLRCLWQRSFDATNGESAKLVGDRKLLWTDTLTHWGVCRSIITGHWLLPGYSPEGKLLQLYRWVKGKTGRMELHATPTLGHQLFGTQLVKKHASTVWVAEGPWDAMALWEVLRSAKETANGLESTGAEANSLLANASVVAVPGCGSVGTPFSRWLPLFAGRKVILLFDSDHPRVFQGRSVPGAGQDACRRAVRILSSADEKPSRVEYLRWGALGYDPKRPSGFDVRDILSAGGTVGERIKLLSSDLLPKLAPTPPEWLSAGLPKLVSKPGSMTIDPVSCNSWPELQNAWRRAMSNWDSPKTGLNKTLSAMLACILSTNTPDDPVWLKVIGPPGCIGGNTHIAYVVKDKSRRIRNKKGGPLRRLHQRFNNLSQRASGPRWERNSEYWVQSATDDGKIVRNKIQGVVYNGSREVFRVTTTSGKTLEATADHEFLTETGYVPLFNLKVGDSVQANSGKNMPKGGRQKRPYRKEVLVKYHPSAPVKMVNNCKYHRLKVYHAVFEASENEMSYGEYVRLLNSGDREVINRLWTIPEGLDVHHKDENPNNNSPDNLVLIDPSHHGTLHSEKSKEHIAAFTVLEEIAAITHAGWKDVYDIICSDPYRNFAAGGVIVHNSGKSTLCEAISVAEKWIFARSEVSGIHSGWKTDKKGEEDHGLVPLLRGKTFVIKDLDTLVNSPTWPRTRAQIRDIFDGAARVHYMHGVSRDHRNIKTTLIFCGTESMLNTADLTELGERFLTVTMIDRIDEEQEKETATRVAWRKFRGISENGDGQVLQRSKEMTLAMQMTAGYVNHLREHEGKILHGLDASEESIAACVSLGTFAAYMRARPSAKQEEVSSRELSARLTAQITGLAMCLAGATGKRVVDESIVDMVRIIALDTSRGKTLEMARLLECPDRKGKIGQFAGTVATMTNQTDDGCRKMLRFLRAIGAVEWFESSGVAGLSNQRKWRLTPRMRELYKQVANQGE